MENDIRLRLAPSPTGFLHVGNLRSALFGYLLAKRLGGKFILRIEDTDEKREVEGAQDKLIEIFERLGIEFDEGPHIGGPYGPYIQTERLDIYREYQEELLAKGKAYRCFCTAQRLEEMRAEQEANKQAPKYDRHCRNLSPEEIEAKLSANEPYVIRQAMPEDGEVRVRDEIRGEIVFQAKELDDQVLIKSNGVPTYHFAAIVDDHLMKISHVTRGSEWLPSLPKNILLFRAFGWKEPLYIHMPLLLNKTGGKLSKRQGDVFVEEYLEKGYLPEALLNFCALLGWHPKGDQEIYSLGELTKIFDVEGIGANPAIFDTDKLDFFNGHYIRQKNIAELTDLLLPHLEKAGLIAKKGDNWHNLLRDKPITRENLERIVALAQDRLVTLSDIGPLVQSYLSAQPDYAPELLLWKSLTREEIWQKLEEMQKILIDTAEKEWTKEGLEEKIFAYIKEKEGKNGDYLWPLRVALTGQKNSPGPFESAWALGREESLKRLAQALTICVQESKKVV